MDHKNIIKKAVCFLLVLCGLIGGMRSGRLSLRADSNEEKVYMEYLAKTSKKLQKKYLKPNMDEHAFDYLISYKVMDLNNDGKKELIYNFLISGFPGSDDPFLTEKGRICTIRNGKVKRMWESDVFHSVSYSILKGAGSKVVMDEYLTGGIHTYTVYDVASNKLKKSVSYIFKPIENEQELVWGYYKNGTKLVKDPFGKKEKKLKRIELVPYAYDMGIS